METTVMEEAFVEGVENGVSRGMVVGYPVSNLRVTLRRILMYASRGGGSGGSSGGGGRGKTGKSTVGGKTNSNNSSSSSNSGGASVIRQTTYQAIQNLLQTSKKGLLQPMMEVQILVPPEYVGVVTRDITGTRQGTITDILTSSSSSSSAMGNDTDTESRKDSGHFETESKETETETLIQIKSIVALRELIGYASILRGMTAGSGDFTMSFRYYLPVSASMQEKIVESIRGY
jgi:translation elongation factor EF-G